MLGTETARRTIIVLRDDIKTSQPLARLHVHVFECLLAYGNNDYRQLFSTNTHPFRKMHSQTCRCTDGIRSAWNLKIRNQINHMIVTGITGAWVQDLDIFPLFAQKMKFSFLLTHVENILMKNSGYPPQTLQYFVWIFSSTTK